MKKWISILVLMLGLAPFAGAQDGGKSPVEQNPYADYILVIDKGAFTLSLLDDSGRALYVYPVATGENPGQKRKEGDCKTPEGIFTVTWVQDTRGVMYDYHDGKGLVEAYGPKFIHLETPGFKYIGVHGTCPERDDRIGKRDSKGCVRLHNEDLLTIIPYVYPGMKVYIIPGPEDIEADNAYQEN